jgi:hypothetical protein
MHSDTCKARYTDSIEHERRQTAAADAARSSALAAWHRATEPIPMTRRRTGKRHKTDK